MVMYGNVSASTCQLSNRYHLHLSQHQFEIDWFFIFLHVRQKLHVQDTTSHLRKNVRLHWNLNIDAEKWKNLTAGILLSYVSVGDF